MTTRITVDFRPNWHQVMDDPIGSAAVRDRMEALARSALLQFTHQVEIRVTAMEDSAQLQIVRDRRTANGEIVPKTCRHCGGFL